MSAPTTSSAESNNELSAQPVTVTVTDATAIRAKLEGKQAPLFENVRLNTLSAQHARQQRAMNARRA